jgi:peptide/nickel transport system permease protein/oligopeptide transport system permease protein
MPDATPTPARRAWRRFLLNRPATLAAFTLAFVLLATLLGPALSPHDPNAGSESPFSPPTARYWFGTDIHGRDLLTRTLVGTRISLLVGLTGAAVSVLIGVAWGLVAAYAGGRPDAFMMRCVDILYALPNIIFVMLVIVLTEGTLIGWIQQTAPGLAPSVRLLLLFACLGAVSWLNMARIVRGQVLSLRHRPFILASRVLGARPLHILIRHLLPNVTGVVIVYATLTVPSVILYESFLSFLGLGIRPPDASLGTLIEDGARQLNPLLVRWWLLLFPAGLLASLLLALHHLGDGLRDALDPRAES